MKEWFLSLSGALTLSALTFLSEVWHGFLDAMFVLPVDFGDEGTMQLAAILFTALNLLVSERFNSCMPVNGYAGAIVADNAVAAMSRIVTWLLGLLGTDVGSAIWLSS